MTCPARSTLRSTLLDNVALPYTSKRTDTWDALRVADADPSNSSLVRLFYSGGTAFGPAEYNAGRGWTREHLWPQSLMHASGNMEPATDVHALRPALGSCNSRRSNHRFGLLPSVVPDEKCNLRCDGSEAVGVCEPPDAIKGEIARALFYMALRYDGRGDVSHGEQDAWVDLRLADVAVGGNSLLLDWNDRFPPTDRERARNQRVADFQGEVSNPFVTSPRLAVCIFGNSSAGGSSPESESIGHNPSNTSSGSDPSSLDAPETGDASDQTTGDEGGDEGAAAAFFQDADTRRTILYIALGCGLALCMLSALSDFIYGNIQQRRHSVAPQLLADSLDSSHAAENESPSGEVELGAARKRSEPTPATAQDASAAATTTPALQKDDGRNAPREHQKDAKTSAEAHVVHAALPTTRL